MAQITVKDASGTNQTVAKVTNTGQAPMADSLPVVIAGDQTALPLDVTLGAGNVDAKTQRVTLAADGPAVTSLTNLDADVGQLNATAAPADGTGNYSVIAGLKRLLLNGAALLARIPSTLTTTPSHDQPAQPVRLVPQDVWNAGFSAVGASVLDPVFTSAFVSGGTTYSQASGSLAIVAPAVANAEFMARSARVFRGAMRMRLSTILSQRIANNNFAAMLADLVGENLAYSIVSATQVNVTIPAHGWTAQMVGQFVNLGAITGAAGIPGRYAIASIVDANTVLFTVSAWPATGTGTLTVFGRNYIRTLFNGTTATAANVDSQRNGWATGDTVATVNTTASPGTVIQADLTGRDVFFADALRATNTTPNFTTRASRYENIPDHNLDLYVFLWSFNGGTAPASPTTWTLGHVSVESFPNLPVFVQGNRSQGTQNAAPVQVVGTPAVTVSSGTVTTVSTVSAITGGGVAEDAAAGANPVVVGGVTRTAAAPATLVAGDAARLTMTAAAAATVAIGAPVASAEVASAARTTTGNSGTISVPTGGSISGLIVVSVASGTTPTLDVTLEESYDNGTTWQQVWAAPRFTGTGNTPIPDMSLAGLRRWVWTISGTTPSFTFAINTNQLATPARKSRKLFDRTANVLNGTNATPTAALNVTGCTNITAMVAIGAATTPATYQMQVSADNVNWTNIGTATPAVANSQVAFSTPAGTVADWARVIVTSAATGQTGTFVSIQAAG